MKNKNEIPEKLYIIGIELYGKKRDVTVELLRIVACFFVICVHLVAQDFNMGRISPSRIFIHTLVCDGVAIFWFILGFFLFRNENFFIVLMKTLKGIVLPSLATLIVIQFLAGWLTRETSFINCFVNPFIDWKNIFSGLLNWSAEGWKLCSSYWFQFSYIKTILWFPLLKGLCVTDKTMIYARRFLMVLTVIEYFFIDVSNFIAIPFRTYSVLPLIVLQVLIGYEIYRAIDKIRGNKKVRILAGGYFY